MELCQMCMKWDVEPDLRIAELEQSFVLLNRDQYFPGYTFVFTRDHVTELFQLDRERRIAVMEEVAAVASSLNTVFKPDKINYELIGNMVPHMHWHLVPRFRDDPFWPRTIWAGLRDERFLGPEDCKRRIELIRKALCK